MIKNYNSNKITGVLHSTFSQGAQSDIYNNYLKDKGSISKWMCYSDYCLDDKNKPNNVVSFSLIPYIHDFNNLSELIKVLAKKDIKKSKKINQEFIDFLHYYPLLNISFILKNRRNLSSPNEDFKTVLSKSFQALIDQCEERKKNNPSRRGYYIAWKKKYQCVLEQIKHNKKLNLIADMGLITMLGAYVSSIVIDKCNPSVFGWFSDRDAIHDICDGTSFNLFHNNLLALTEFRGQFVFSNAKSTSDPIFDDFIRIPDYIAGTLADLNFEEMAFSKPKFSTIFTEYMAENTHNNFIFEMDFKSDGGITCQRFTINKSSD